MYRMVYKCRLCGQKFYNGDAGRKEAMEICDALIDREGYSLTINRTCRHLCLDGSIGMCDFQGFEVARDDKCDNKNEVARAD